jgi:hypothetical protein
MADYLLGSPTTYVNGGRIAGNYFAVCGFTASYTGTATEFWLYGRNTGNAKFGIWDDDNDYPGDLLYAQNTGQAIVSDQWNVFTGLNLSITQGNKYWLGGNASTYGVIAEHLQAGAGYYRVSTSYSTWVCPDPAPTGMSQTSSDLLALGLYGTMGSGEPSITTFNGHTITNYSFLLGYGYASIDKIIGHDKG